jgi:hypothetical protein
VPDDAICRWLGRRPRVCGICRPHQAASAFTTRSIAPAVILLELLRTVPANVAPPRREARCV